MASVIKSIVDQYKKEVIEQNDWSLTSELKKQETVISKKTGSFFLSIITTILLDQNDIQIRSQNYIQKQKRKLLQSLRIKYKQEDEVLERIFGMFIMQFLQKDEKLSNLYNQIYTNFEVEQLSLESMDLNSQDEDNQTSIYSLANVSKISNQDMQNNYNKLVEEQSFINFLQQNIQNDKGHQHIVNEYITKLSAPQTELTYICQHFGWRGAFKDRYLKNGNFQVTAAVDFQFKNLKKELTTNAQYKNKKIARMLSAAKLLRSLYISFPQVWTIYSKIRNEKSLNIPEDPNNSLLLQQAIKDQKIEIVKVNKRNQEEFQRQLYQYLGQISSFKSEMNILLQQIIGIFTHPKMEKIPFDNKWKVKGELFMKNNSTGEVKHYLEIEVNTNSKQAEETVAKKILSKMYLQNKEILETMVILKKKKGFKT